MMSLRTRILSRASEALAESIGLTSMSRPWAALAKLEVSEDVRDWIENEMEEWIESVEWTREDAERDLYRTREGLVHDGFCAMAVALSTELTQGPRFFWAIAEMYRFLSQAHRWESDRFHRIAEKITQDYLTTESQDRSGR